MKDVYNNSFVCIISMWFRQYPKKPKNRSLLSPSFKMAYKIIIFRVSNYYNNWNRSELYTSIKKILKFILYNMVANFLKIAITIHLISILIYKSILYLFYQISILYLYDIIFNKFISTHTYDWKVKSRCCFE